MPLGRPESNDTRRNRRHSNFQREAEEVLAETVGDCKRGVVRVRRAESHFRLDIRTRVGSGAASEIPGIRQRLVAGDSRAKQHRGAGFARKRHHFSDVRWIADGEREREYILARIVGYSDAARVVNARGAERDVRRSSAGRIGIRAAAEIPGVDERQRTAYFRGEAEVGRARRAGQRGNARDLRRSRGQGKLDALAVVAQRVFGIVLHDAVPVPFRGHERVLEHHPALVFAGRRGKLDSIKDLVLEAPASGIPHLDLAAGAVHVVAHRDGRDIPDLHDVAEVAVNDDR